MSRTVRRNHFNKKSRFFQHYWEAFSDAEIERNDYIELWKYHSDNYYTKKTKNIKQFYKILEYRSLRRNFKLNISKTLFLEDLFLKKTKAKSIKWNIH